MNLVDSSNEVARIIANILVKTIGGIAIFILAIIIALNILILFLTASSAVFIAENLKVFEKEVKK